MKKKFIFIVVTGMLFAALTGCSGTVENSNTSKNENSIQQSEGSKVGETSENSANSESSVQEGNTETNEDSTVSEASSDNSTITDGQSTLTVYVLEVSEGSMKGESIPGEEGSEEDIKTITIYNENINTEDISEGMVVTIIYTGDLKANGEEYTVNADSFETL